MSNLLDEAGLPASLQESIRYALLGGGKRLRPALTLLCCRAVRGEDETAIGPAASMEMIHTFSLVHDDLPAMDDDDLRRGRPTLHVKAGEAMAILAGDAMMSLAFEVIAASPLDDEQCRAVLLELSRGTTAMIAGQVYDTLGGFPDGVGDSEKLQLIHRNKTAALLRAACRIGGICGRASDVHMKALTSYGEAIGLMFQIVDDVLDVTQSTEHLGKGANKDLSAGKLTYPGLLGLERSRDEINRLERESRTALEPLGEAGRPLAELCEYLAVRTR